MPEIVSTCTSCCCRSCSGRELWERTDGVRMAAFDSSFTAGVFQLETGDKLSVQADNHGATCSVIGHHDQTFIGAIRLQMDTGLPPPATDD